MADPAYIDADGVLTDGEAWVPISSSTPTSTLLTLSSTNDGQVGDWSQYLDLVAIVYAQGSVAQEWEWLKGAVNNDYTNDKYAYQLVYTDGNASVSGVKATTNELYYGYTVCANESDYWGGMIVDFHDINSGKYKSIQTRSAADWGDGGRMYLNSQVYMGQEPITSIQMHVGSSGTINFISGTRIDLFGVLPRMVA